MLKPKKGGILYCLNELFDEVYIPKAVEIECKDPETIAEVKILGLKVRSVRRVLSIGMGRGEREAISLVSELGHPAVLITNRLHYTIIFPTWL